MNSPGYGDAMLERSVRLRKHFQALVAEQVRAFDPARSWQTAADDIILCTPVGKLFVEVWSCTSFMGVGSITVSVSTDAPPGKLHHVEAIREGLDTLDERRHDDRFWNAHWNQEQDAERWLRAALREAFAVAERQQDRPPRCR